MGNATLDEALRLADEGVPVFPCRPLGKDPVTAHSFLDASTDARRIKEWWRRTPTANLAVPTGLPGFDVLDIDVRSSGSGLPAMERLRTSGLLAGAVRIVATPSGGLHIYFPASGNASGSLPRHHLDFKARGGYVLVPPSFVVTDDYEGSYLEIEDKPVNDGRPLDWAKCKRLLTPVLRVPARRATYGRGGRNSSGLAQWVGRQPEGNRNLGLFWACSKAAERGQDLEPIAQAAMATGLSERETRRTAESARKRVAKP